MYQEFYARSGQLTWPVLGLLIFALLFVGVLAFVLFGLRDQEKLERIAALPLEPESVDLGLTEGRMRP